MTFNFFRGKQPGPREIACPLCDHRQPESPLAVSSYCKGCGAYLTFKGGRVKARPKTVENPFENRPPQPKVEIDHRAREEPPRPFTPPAPPPAAPAPEKVPAQDPSAETEIANPKQPLFNPAKAPGQVKTASIEKPDLPPEAAKDEPSKSLFDKNTTSKALNTRKAKCFECGDTHEANALSNSTQCRKCGRMISLASHDIKGPWSSRIQTRGDVFIHKKGSVTGATIECHHMTVEGDFTGSVECTGDLTLRRHGKIAGKIICDRLLVERRAKVDFLNPVETNECRIDGLVTGDIDCRGRLALEKKATLTGDIKVGTLTVADGAKHSGQIQMGGF